jgi:hypothetical protein
MNHKINEAASDMFRANLSRFGQGIKNVLGAGNVTTDSKDKGVETLFLRFKEKFDKITPSTPTITPIVSTSTTASITPPSSVPPPTTGATGSSTGSSSATSSATGSVTGSSSVTGSTSSESRYFIYAAKNLLTPLIKIYKQPKPATLTISGSHLTDYRTSPIVCVTSSAFNGNINIRGLVNGREIDNKYLGKESKGSLLTYWIKPEYINIYSNITASLNVTVSYRVLYSDKKTTPAAKNGGISYATTLTINPKGTSIVPEGIINEALNTEQQELYLDFLKDLSWYFKIQPNPDMSTYNPEKVLEWMKTQGERFKYIVDYLDQKLGTTAPTVPPTVPTTATSGSSDVNEQLKKELDIFISDEFLTNLSIIYPEKILDSKLKDNANTRMPNSSKTVMAFKIEGNKISSLQLKFNSKNTIRFTLAINSTAFKAQEPNLFTEVTIPEIARLSKVFETKLFNTLTFRYVNNTSLSGGKSFEELKNAIEKYLTPRVDAAANKMTDSIRLTLISIIKENNEINDVIFVGINNKGIKFIINDPITENKLFKINDSKNKNIFKLR